DRSALFSILLQELHLQFTLVPYTTLFRSKVAVYKQDGSETGDIELNEAVFGVEPNNHIMNEVVLMQRAANRHGTHAVKNRGEVRRGGAKPWRQKGRGRARHGSTRSPEWAGGGAGFGPTTSRKYKYKLPKKVRKSALKSALASKVKQDEIIVLDDLQFDAPKTKEALQVLEALNVNEKVLIVTADKNDNVIYSTNNIPR